MQIFIETPRLLLREIIPEDAEGMFLLDSDAEVHRYLGNKPVTSVQQCREVIDFIRAQYVSNGIGRWAMVEKASGQFIGWCGLKLVKDTINRHSDFYDLGYRLIRSYWGNGYASEAATACVHYAFHQMQLPMLYGMTAIDNSASRSVLLKAGLKYVESFMYENEAHYWFEISRLRFLSQQ
ncbi:Protein N-acetyltransferase, RimJ/RimL family [Filimonas lacunae]|uniref:Protein N-acetyltransferase, RimJ/RimL family n=1 Tax=Filimonas lacunae TaxID=477680 RepID=A0A173MF94_9BACT|nr:GNAT family N-acetyltransferase [Filimonas lacunae]BAV06273.1 GCN5-related N-acetyltransferase [Filimonas lacunae]SIT25590.1 Protein N-acetyltransferase, RimJ/RimL family [Filimonas lacunae]